MHVRARSVGDEGIFIFSGTLITIKPDVGIGFVGVKVKP